MVAAAALQVLALLLLALAVPRLAAAAWPLRAPTPALLLWQALGLAGGLLALEAAAIVALAPLGSTPRSAVRMLPGALGRWSASRWSLPWWSMLAAAVFVAVLLRLVTVLGTSTVRTLQARHRHRVLVDLVATRNPLLRGASVVDHDVPVAYCLPGLRPRVVLSRAVLTALDEGELRAVLDHELAHVAARHDLVVLPFVALRATFPWLGVVCCAADSVALLVEVLADDRAARRHDGRLLARALYKVGSLQAPVGGLGVGSPGSAVLVRTSRLLDPPPALPRPLVCLVLAGAAAVAALPGLGLLVPTLTG